MKSFMILCRNTKPDDINIENISGLLVSFGCTHCDSSDILGEVLNESIISEIKCQEVSEIYKDWKDNNNELVLYMAEHDSKNGIKIMENSNKRFRNQNSL